MILPLQGISKVYYAQQLESVIRTEGLTVRSSAQAPDGYVWLISDKGIARFDGYRIIHLPCPESALQTIHEADTLSLCPDEKNHLLWIHSNEGVVGGMDWLSETFIDIPQLQQGKYEKCHHGEVYHWLYGTSKGCHRIRYINSHFEIEQYPYNIRQIVTDEGGNDWILTDDGLFRNGFDKVLPSSKGIKHIAVYREICLGLTQEKLLIYNRSRQIVRDTPLPISYKEVDLKLKVQDDILWIYSPNSTHSYQMIDGIFTTHSSIDFTMTKQDSLNTSDRQQEKTTVVVSQLTANGKTLISPYKWKELPTGNIEIGFTILSFFPEEKWFYQFYLEGVDSNWSVPTSNPIAVYSQLPAGTYKFHVRASTDREQWGNEESYIFSITPPWWHNPIVWLTTCSIILVGIGIIGIQRFDSFKSLTINFIKKPTITKPLEEPLNSTPTEITLRKVTVPWHDINTHQKQHTTNGKKEPSTLRDERFKLLLEEIIVQHITDPNFTIDTMASLMQMGRTRFYIRTKEVLGCSPAELLRNHRLEYAAKLLLTTNLTVDKVRSKCCFSNSTNFYTSFKLRFGATPLQYRQLKKGTS